MARGAKVQGNRADLHLRIRWDAYDALDREEHMRALAGIRNTKAEIVEQALFHLIATRIPLQALKLLDDETARRGVRGDHACRAAIVAELIEQHLDAGDTCTAMMGEINEALDRY